MVDIDRAQGSLGSPRTAEGFPAVDAPHSSRPVRNGGKKILSLQLSFQSFPAASGSLLSSTSTNSCEVSNLSNGLFEEFGKEALLSEDYLKGLLIDLELKRGDWGTLMNQWDTEFDLAIGNLLTTTDISRAQLEALLEKFIESGRETTQKVIQSLIQDISKIPVDDFESRLMSPTADEDAIVEADTVDLLEVLSLYSDGSSSENSPEASVAERQKAEIEIDPDLSENMSQGELDDVPLTEIPEVSSISLGGGDGGLNLPRLTLPQAQSLSDAVVPKSAPCVPLKRIGEAVINSARSISRHVQSGIGSARRTVEQTATRVAATPGTFVKIAGAKSASATSAAVGAAKTFGQLPPTTQLATVLTGMSAFPPVGLAAASALGVLASITLTILSGVSANKSYHHRKALVDLLVENRIRNDSSGTTNDPREKAVAETLEFAARQKLHKAVVKVIESVPLLSTVLKLLLAIRKTSKLTASTAGKQREMHARNIMQNRGHPAVAELLQEILSKKLHRTFERLAAEIDDDSQHLAVDLVKGKIRSS